MTTTNNTPARRQENTPAAQAPRPPAPAQAEQTVQDMIRTSWSAITQSLPASMDSKRFARLVFNAVRNTPKLALATAPSMIGSVLTASALGLEIGLNNEAHLVPYLRKNKRTGQEWMEAQLQVGYGGYVKLFQQHPMARGVSTGWVGAKDQFSYAYGTASFLDHRPTLGDRGEPIAFWAAYELSNGVRDFLVLSPREVAELRGKPLNEVRDVADPQHWMERKTVLKQVLKLAPKSTSMQWAMAVDEKPGGDLDRERTHVAIAANLPPEPQRVLEADQDVIDEETGEVLSEEPVIVPQETQPAPETATSTAAGVGEEAAVPAREPAASSAPERVVMIRTAQRTKLRGECARLGIQADSELKMRYLSAIVARPLATVEDLTVEEAEGTIGVLLSMSSRDALDSWIAGVEPIL